MKVLRYYGCFLNAQEKWLNRMAEKGYRLVRTGTLLHEFEACAPSEYEYRIEFIADKDASYIGDYRRFLEEMGYRTFTKNINLNFSLGKVRLRPWAKGSAKVATNPGNYNQELLIIERRKDGKPFKMHTGEDAEALVRYCKTKMNRYLSYSLMFALGVLFSIIMETSVSSSIFAGVLSIIFFVQGVIFAFALHHADSK